MMKKMEMEMKIKTKCQKNFKCQLINQIKMVIALTQNNKKKQN